MSETAPSYDRKAVQRARAAYLRDVLLEPWSLRRIEGRTGLGRSVLANRLNGETPLTLDDIELLAPLARMTPEAMFEELRKVVLPGLDSNQEPIDFKPALVLGGDIEDELSAYRRAKLDAHKAVLYVPGEAPMAG